MRQRQRGAALIVALLIVTLAASTAAFAIWQQSLWVRQLENVTDRAKADQLAAGGIDLARNVLKDDKADTTRPPNVDSLNEPWASAIVLPAEDVTLSGQIVDAQGRFNINTASAEVLAAVTGLSLNQAQIIVKQRDSTPYRDLGAFNTAVKAASPNATCPNAACDVQSNYFLATIRVKSGRIEAGYTVLLDRSQTTTPWPSIKWRKEAAD